MPSLSSPSAFSNPGLPDPSDASNFPTPLSPPRSPSPRLRTTSSLLLPPPLSSSSSPSASSSTSSLQPPTLPSITSSLLQTSLSLKCDFRFLKLTARESHSHRSSLQIALVESETHKLLQTSHARLNSATLKFIRDANNLLDEKINRSFDAYLHGHLPRFEQQFEDYDSESNSESDSDSGYSSPDGDEEELEEMMKSVEEKETRRELERLVGVVEELRGVFFKKAGKYLLSAKERKEGSEEVKELVVGRLLNGDGEGEDGDNAREGLERKEYEDVREKLGRLAKRLGRKKLEEVRVCRL